MSEITSWEFPCRHMLRLIYETTTTTWPCTIHLNGGKTFLSSVSLPTHTHTHVLTLLHNVFFCISPLISFYSSSACEYYIKVGIFMKWAAEFENYKMCTELTFCSLTYSARHDDEDGDTVKYLRSRFFLFSSKPLDMEERNCTGKFLLVKTPFAATALLLWHTFMFL